jgi:hypothetical protein
MPPAQRPDEGYVQLATRLPESVLRRVKVWCVQNDTTMQQFTADALRERLLRAGKPKE